MYIHYNPAMHYNQTRARYIFALNIGSNMSAVQETPFACCRPCLRPLSLRMRKETNTPKEVPIVVTHIYRW